MPTVFVSYSHVDARIAHEVEGVLRELGVDTFSSDRIPVGASIGQVVNDELKAADGYVFLVSEDFARSEWANVELAAAVAQTTVGIVKPLVPILIGDIETSHVPELLRRYQWIDFRKGVSPDPLAQLATGLFDTSESRSTKAQLDAEAELLHLRERMLAETRQDQTHRMLETQVRRSTFLSHGIAVMTTLIAVLGLGALITSVLSREQANAAWFALAGGLLGSWLTAIVFGFTRIRRRRQVVEAREHGRE